MKTRKSNLLFLFFLLLAQTATSQRKDDKIELKGDTIFVNERVDVQVVFPTENIAASFADKTAPFEFTNNARNFIMLAAKKETPQCAVLHVNEGKRNHSFIICYKKNINSAVTAETKYDYSTMQLLTKRKKYLEDRDENKSLAVSTPVQEVKRAPAGVPEGYSRIKGILDEASALLKKEQLTEAEKKYYEVLSIQADNETARKGLSDINNKREEHELLVKKEQNDKLLLLRAKANSYYYEKKYDQALAAYKDILAVAPSDVYAQSQVGVIEKLKEDNDARARLESERKEKAAAEEKINTMRTAANRAFNDKKYDEALTAYQNLLTVSPADAMATERIEAIQKIKEQAALIEKQERRNRDREETFKALVRDGDKAYQQNEYEVAKAAYNAAKELKPTDAALLAKLNVVSQQIEQKEKNVMYTAIITTADEAKSAGDYEKAKTEYARAQKLTAKTYPAEQISSINKLLADIEAKAKAEKLKEEKEKEEISVYTTTIQQADKLFEKQDFTNARPLYARAAKMKPADNYPAEKIADIEKLIEKKQSAKKEEQARLARIAETETKYKAAILQGKTAFDQKQYEVAKEAYTRALKLKPEEAEPVTRLNLIDSKLASGQQYDELIGKGNLAMGSNNYPDALQYYKQAQVLKPLDNFTLNQIRFLQDRISADSAVRAQAQKKEEEKVVYQLNLQRFKEGMSYYEKFEKAANVADYEEQLYNAKQYLNLLPDDEIFNERQHTQKQEWVKDKMKQVRDYLTRQRGPRYQPEAIPYLILELEKKYENINFNAPPPEQELSPEFKFDVRENSAVVKQVIKLPNTYNFSDSTAQVKVTCTAIKQLDNSTFIKVQVSNSSDKELLTGAMMLQEVMKGGKETKHLPLSISSFPIVLPGKQFYVVYEVPVINVKDDSKMFFHFTDRTGKYHLKVPIPAAAFATEGKDN